MSANSRFTARFTAITVFAATLLAVLVAGCGSSPAGPPSATAYHWTGAQLVQPLAKPEFTLTDQQGNPFDFRRDTAGKVTLLYFGYTHCPDICPENMSLLAFALKRLPSGVRSRIAVVFVTTDPARDTAAALASWLGNFNAGFIGLTGDKAQVDLAQAQARVSLASPEPATPGSNYAVDHAAQIICYTPDNQAHVVFFQGMTNAGVAHDLERLVTSGWTGA